MHGDAEQALEEAREQHLWGRLVLVLWISLIFASAIALLWILTAALAWQPYAALCLLGSLAGMAAAAAFAGSRRRRAMSGLVIGGLLLPLLAAYLSGLAARSPEAFTAGSAALLPFLTYATVALISALSVSSLWRGRAAPPRPDQRTPAEPAPHTEGAPR